MKVLSLFDGISCGKVALARAGIKVDKYYASEIDKYAVAISKKQHGSIYHLGDIQNWKDWNIENPDLIIGGSPCQAFSFAGKQLNFEDPRSRLFYTYVYILKHYKPKYFLFENVKMKKEYQDVISKHLGVEPIEINSALVSAHNRKRLYWTNMPNISQPEDKCIYLRDILENDVGEYYKINKKYKLKKFQDKGSCLTGGGNSGGNHSDMDLIAYGAAQKDSLVLEINQNEYNIRRLTTLECERLQTLPDNYTEIGINEKGEEVKISNTQRYKALGNGWTVDVIVHILKNI